jgi:hypothetical protein
MFSLCAGTPLGSMLPSFLGVIPGVPEKLFLLDAW